VVTRHLPAPAYPERSARTLCPKTPGEAPIPPPKSGFPTPTVARSPSPWTAQIRRRMTTPRPRAGRHLRNPTRSDRRRHPTRSRAGHIHRDEASTPSAGTSPSTSARHSTAYTSPSKVRCSWPVGPSANCPCQTNASSTLPFTPSSDTRSSTSPRTAWRRIGSSRRAPTCTGKPRRSTAGATTCWA
jgi:hypothetical protein